MDISSEHEQDEEAAGAAAAAAAQAAGEPVEEVEVDPNRPPPLQLQLTPEEIKFEEESAARFAAASERLQEISRKMPPDQAVVVPENAVELATVNLIVELLQERGIVRDDEFILRRRRHLALVAEQAATQAEAMVATDTGLVDAGGNAIRRPQNRRERRHPKKR